MDWVLMEMVEERKRKDGQSSFIQNRGRLADTLRKLEKTLENARRMSILPEARIVLFFFQHVIYSLSKHTTSHSCHSAPFLP
jgi:hypothetical protein